MPGRPVQHKKVTRRIRIESKSGHPALVPITKGLGPLCTKSKDDNEGLGDDHDDDHGGGDSDGDMLLGFELVWSAPGELYFYVCSVLLPFSFSLPNLSGGWTFRVCFGLRLFSTLYNI